METNKKTIDFFNEDGENVPFYVLEQVTIAGVNYILVTDSDDEEDEEAAAYILKEMTEANEETIYEMVEDDVEMEAISKVFEETLEDIDIEI